MSVEFRPALIPQKDVAVLLSSTGKPVGAYTIKKMVENGTLPEPITKKSVQGLPKLWSVDELCEKLKINEDRLFKTIRKSH